MTLVRRSDGRVRFLVCKDLQDADEDIAEYGDGSVILCTDGYTIYDDSTADPTRSQPLLPRVKPILIGGDRAGDPEGIAQARPELLAHALFRRGRSLGKR